MNEFRADRLVELRSRRVISQRELSEVSGIPQATISRIETGVQRPRPSTIRKLAKALGVEPEELLYDRARSQ